MIDMIKIVGAAGKINTIKKFLEVTGRVFNKYKIEAQFFDAEMIYGKKHLISAFNHAKRAMEQNTNTSNSLSMELLLYASGERQLKIAIPKMGIKKDKSNIAIVFLTDVNDNIINEILDELSLKRDDKILEGDIITLKKFGLKNKEIETVTKDKYLDLILEKVSLVDIIK